MNLKNNDSTDMSAVQLVVLCLMVFVVGLMVGDTATSKQSLGDRLDRIEARQVYLDYGRYLYSVPPTTTTTPPENPTPKRAVTVPSGNSVGVTIVLTNGRSVYDALYDAAFREGYPSQIYQDATEQRTVALAKVDVWLAQIKLQIAREPVCFTGLQCITDINTVPERTVVDVDYTRVSARLAPPSSVPFN